MTVAPHRPGSVLVLAVQHRPFEIAVLIATLASTLVEILTGPSPTLAAFDAVLPGYQWIWMGGVVAGASLALAAMLLRTPTRLLLERTGLSVLAVLFLTYGGASVALFGAVDPAGSNLGANLLLAAGVAAVFRIAQLTRDIRVLKGLSAGRRLRRR